MTSYFQFNFLIYYDTTAWLESTLLTLTYTDSEESEVLVKSQVTSYKEGKIPLIVYLTGKPLKNVTRVYGMNLTVYLKKQNTIIVQKYWFHVTPISISIKSSVLILPFTHFNVIFSGFINLVAKDGLIEYVGLQTLPDWLDSHLIQL